MIRPDVNVYCCEDISTIENYDKAIKAKSTWDIHHKREITENKSKQQLIDEGLYFNRPANELIFLSRKEHNRIHREHNPQALENWLKAGADANKGRQKTDKEKQQISETLKEYFKTHHPGNYGRPATDEFKQKLSLIMKTKYENGEINFSDEARKACSEAGKRTAKIKKCYIDENGNEVWMRPSLKSRHHPNWKLKEDITNE